MTLSMKNRIPRLCIIGMLALVIYVLIGCAVTQVTKQYVRRANLNDSSPEAGKSRVVVLREKGHVGFVVLYLSDDGAAIGDLDMGSYLAWERSSGKGVLRLRHQIIHDLQTEVNVDFESGKIYYYRAIFHGTRVHDAMELSSITEREARALLPKLVGPIN